MSSGFLQKLFILIISVILLSSCGSSRSKVVTKKSDNKKSISAPYKLTPNAEAEDEVANKIINTAMTFEGTRYKYGGTDKKGMDCSGLVYVAFNSEGIDLPRTSRAMSLQGQRLYLKDVAPGDLLFFETNKNRKVINHVGLVVEVKRDGIYFIHSSSSKGVITSSLSEPYWLNNFVMARRVI